MRCIFINRTIGMTSFSTGTNPLPLVPMDHQFDKWYLFAASNTVDLQNYVAKIWEVLLNINYFVTNPRKKGLSAFI